MLYRVKVGDEYSEAFNSTWGIMAGDSISPALFLAYTFDFEPPLSSDDVIIEGVHISKLAFADDVIFLLFANRNSPSISAMQDRLSWVEGEYCARVSFLELNASKSLCCIIGARHQPDAPLTVIAPNGGDTQPIDYVDHFRYGGIHFSSDLRNTFYLNYKTWASKAQNAAYNVISTESFVGSLPIREGIRLYFALVDPYLIFGCDVIIDTIEKNLRTLEKVQLYFLRRLLGLNPRSPIGPLFTETGVMPIRHRRIILALRFARYALLQDANHFVNLAFRDAIQMHTNGKRSWVTDLETALKRLPLFPVILDIRELENVAGIDSLIDQVQSSCAQFLYQSLDTERLPLLKGELRPIVSTSFQTVLCLRKYLRTVRVPAHRRALLSLLCADHSLGVEQFRRRRYPDKSRIPPECRACRYCDAPTETEIHALFRCEGPEESSMLIDRRLEFMERVDQVDIGALGERLVSRCTSDTDESAVIAIHFFLEHDDLAPAFAKYVYDVLEMFPISL
ncbi:hypothetical protein DFP72DRAFT_817063 [Ephemerocybe angulata]|uniref:Reverse transcriptase domain-containing protein n=1 Tax=Ephemerocybe angulata TaxID=980116 RepID=A0A8H6HPS4_9AGAR|nr:hypothetical protein DFP72DRAFT_817063 [Tulosesus angulatus]